MSAARVKPLWLKDEYLQQVMAGRKTVEVRVGYSNIRRLQVGDVLLLNDRYRYAIRRIACYADLLAHEDPSRIAPDLPSGELLPRLRELYPPEKEALGVVAMEVEPEESAILSQ